MKKIKKELTLFLLMFSGTTALVAQSDLVSAILTGYYLPGIINIRDFPNPSPASGLILLDYNIFLSGNKFYGADGNRVTLITCPLGASIDTGPGLSICKLQANTDLTSEQYKVSNLILTKSICFL